MKQKMIFFDIDGTILDENKEIPDSTRYAIYQLKRQGHQIAIATGRSPFMFEEIRSALGINTYISFNGQYVVCDEDVIYKNPIPKHDLLKLESSARENDHPMGFMTPQKVTANVDSHHYLKESFATLAMKPPKYEPDYHKESDVYQALLFCEASEDIGYDDYKVPFDFIRWHQVAMDVIPKGGSKAKGIQQLLNHLIIDIQDTIAFGDALNDIAMLKFVNQGVAMGNSYEETKQVADFVTKHVNDDGLYYGLKQIGLI